MRFGEQDRDMMNVMKDRMNVMKDRADANIRKSSCSSILGFVLLLLLASVPASAAVEDPFNGREVIEVDLDQPLPDPAEIGRAHV